MASRTEEMVRHLKALQMNTPDIEASAVVSVDGLIMASALPSDVAVVTGLLLATFAWARKRPSA